MKRIGLYCVAVVAFTVCSRAATNEWSLVWSDEFNGTGLVDTSKWVYEKGFVRNSEAQYYTVARKENARMENGVLVIEGRKEEYTAPDGKHSHYTAASVNTDGKFTFTHGRVEVRAKLPRGRGMWPAIWTLGTNIHKIGWPKCGEIDIMENVGYNEGNVHATVHWFDYGQGRHASKGSTLPDRRPWDGFHVYAMDWLEDRIDFYYDGQKYFTYPLDAAGKNPAENPFNMPHYLLLNLAIGGTWGGRKGIDDSIFPQRYEIDYVRIYRLK